MMTEHVLVDVIEHDRRQTLVPTPLNRGVRTVGAIGPMEIMPDAAGSLLLLPQGASRIGRRFAHRGWAEYERVPVYARAMHGRVRTNVPSCLRTQAGCGLFQRCQWGRA